MLIDLAGNRLSEVPGEFSLGSRGHGCSGDVSGCLTVGFSLILFPS